MKFDSLKQQTIKMEVSLLYTYKQFLFASSVFKFASVFSEILLIGIGTVLTMGASASYFDLPFMIGLSITVSAISLARVFWNPAGKSSKYHQVGRKYQYLFEDVDDFMKIRLNDDESLKDLIQRYELLKKEKQELNEESPEISTFWYSMMKIIKGDRILDEVDVTDEEIEVIK